MSATVVTFDDLPATLPVFPLSGVLLLPRGSLPLNIFEPRYRNMTADAMASDRLIGMVQPMAPEEIPVTPTGEIKNLDRERLPLYSIGCAGRIAAFEETPDGRYLLSGWASRRTGQVARGHAPLFRCARDQGGLDSDRGRRRRTTHHGAGNVESIRARGKTGAFGSGRLGGALRCFDCHRGHGRA